MTAYPIRTAVKTASDPTQASCKHRLQERKGKNQSRRGTGHTSQTGKPLSAILGPVFSMRRLGSQGRPPASPPSWSRRATAFEPDPQPRAWEGVGAAWRKNSFLWRKVFGEPGTAFESFLSSVVQRRQLCWWKNSVPQKELIYQTQAEKQLREETGTEIL